MRIAIFLYIYFVERLSNVSIRFTVTEELDIFDTINGILPSQIVTLSGDQFIPGTTTFRHLEVTEALNVRLTVQLL